MTSTSLLQILSSESSAASDRALGKLADFFGLQADLVLLPADATESMPELSAVSVSDRTIALSFDTLRCFADRAWFDQLVENARFLLIYGFSPGIGESSELKKLTGEALVGVAALPSGDCQFAVRADLPGGPYPVSGMSYTVPSPAQPVFVEGPKFAAGQSLLSGGGRPYFVFMPRRGGAIFLLAEEALVDIETPLTPDSSLRPWYAQLVALSVFFRGVYGSGCWSTPAIVANFIVDDPYLKKRYGFIRYETLLENLRRTGVALTVAFIPYNYRRSDPGTVDLLRAASDRFSIAVHGCDHTGGEYSSADGGWLEATTACASERMERHRRQTGMPFDNIMVFPQGRFSTAAIGALKSCGFIAAVNTSPWPSDWERIPATLREALDVAVTRYERFPIFVRRYPQDIFDYAFDALLQKPILVVEHHQYFRNGFEPLEALGQDLAKFSPSVRWMPLGPAIRSSYLVRRDRDCGWALRHYISEFSHRNLTGSDLVFAVEKPESEGSVEAVLVDGKSVPYEVKAGWLRYSASARAGQEISAKVCYRTLTPQPRKSSWKYRLGVSGRRFLSDLRDNYLARNERILRIVESLMKKFRRPNDGTSSPP